MLQKTKFIIALLSFLISAGVYGEPVSSNELRAKLEKEIPRVREFAAIEELAKKNNLKIYLFGGTASATRPGDMALISPDDKVLIIIDGKSALFLDEVTLHYNGGLNGKGFEFNNPKAKTTCGCGSSFGV